MFHKIVSTDYHGFTNIVQNKLFFTGNFLNFLVRTCLNKTGIYDHVISPISLPIRQILEIKFGFRMVGNNKKAGLIWIIRQITIAILGIKILNREVDSNR